MILATAILAFGATAMMWGVLQLWQWAGGDEQDSGRGGYDSHAPSQSDWLFMDLRFLALVVAPLLGGAILILLGLTRLL